MRHRLRRIFVRLAHLAHVGWMRLRRPVTLGVKAALFDAEGRVLLVKHTYVKGWHLPGGGVSRDEKMSEAARREVREELGLALTGELPLVALYFAPHNGKSDHIALFRATAFEGEITRNWEIAEADFFHLTDLPRATTGATRRRIEELAGRRAIEERW